MSTTHNELSSLSTTHSEYWSLSTAHSEYCSLSTTLKSVSMCIMKQFCSNEMLTVESVNTPVLEAGKPHLHRLLVKAIFFVALLYNDVWYIVQMICNELLRPDYITAHVYYSITMHSKLKFIS